MSTYPGMTLAVGAALRDRMLPVSEVFGPVWQGEGPYTGRTCQFLRLGGCNLHCEWCDTPYTWDDKRYDVAAECPPREPSWVLERLRGGPSLVVLSGGEPLMHQRNPALLDVLSDREFYWHVETNGTIVPTPWLVERVSHFTVSPKINTVDPAKKTLKPKPLHAFALLAQRGRAIFKVVVKDGDDVELAYRLFELYGVPQEARWVMPEGTTVNGLLDTARRIAPHAQAWHLNLSLRQHTLMYGTERKR